MNIIFALLMHILPACATEDSNNCYWDASTRGNMVGVSFVTINNHTYHIKEK